MAKARLLPTLGEGFKLIAREPFAVFAWGLVSIVTAIAPLALYWALIGPDFLQALNVDPNGAAEPAPEMMRNLALANAVQLLQWVTSMVGAGIIYTAVFRAVLRPEEKSFARMRFGLAEFHMGVTLLVIVLLLTLALVVAMIVIAIPVIIVAAIAAAGSGGGMGSIAAISLVPLAMFGSFIVLACILARFAIALPMTFADGKIRIFEAWTFTKGYARQLAALGFLQMLLIMGIYIVAMIVIVAVGLGSIGLSPEAIEGAFTSETGLRKLVGAGIAAAVIYALLIFVLTPIMLAPWARAYQLIAKDRQQSEMEVFS